jgi:hypothetical protein
MTATNIGMDERAALFITHANPEDNAFTTWLGAKLSVLGYETWADVLAIRGGEDWQRKLEHALRHRARKVLLVGTSRGVQKQGVRNEIQIAHDVGKAIADHEFIIPLRLEPFEAPFLIAHAQYVDFQPGWSAGLNALIETLVGYGVPRKSLHGDRLARADNHWIQIQEIHARRVQNVSVLSGKGLDCRVSRRTRSRARRAPLEEAANKAASERHLRRRTRLRARARG